MTFRLPVIFTHLHFKGEILLQILDNHDEKRKFDAKCLLGIARARNKSRGNVRRDDFEDE